MVIRPEAIEDFDPLDAELEPVAQAVEDVLNITDLLLYYS